MSLELVIFKLTKFIYIVACNGISCIFPQQKDGARILNASFDYGDGTEVQTDVTNCHEIKIFGSDKCDNINMWGSTGAVKVSGDEHNKDEVFIDKNSSVQIIADEQDRVVLENDFFEHDLPPVIMLFRRYTKPDKARQSALTSVSFPFSPNTNLSPFIISSPTARSPFSSR